MKVTPLFRIALAVILTATVLGGSEYPAFLSMEGLVKKVDAERAVYSPRFGESASAPTIPLMVVIALPPEVPSSERLHAVPAADPVPQRPRELTSAEVIPLMSRIRDVVSRPPTPLELAALDYLTTRNLATRPPTPLELSVISYLSDRVLDQRPPTPLELASLDYLKSRSLESRPPTPLEMSILSYLSDRTIESRPVTPIELATADLLKGRTFDSRPPTPLELAAINYLSGRSIQSRPPTSLELSAINSVAARVLEERPPTPLELAAINYLADRTLDPTPPSLRDPGNDPGRMIAPPATWASLTFRYNVPMLPMAPIINVDPFEMKVSSIWKRPHGEWMNTLLKRIRQARVDGDAELYNELVIKYSTWANKYLMQEPFDPEDF